MFTNYTTPPPYSSRSAREIEIASRKMERQLELERMEAGPSVPESKQKRNIFSVLATILFS